MLESLDRYLRFRLRMCIWKQWKNPRTRVKRLRQCGFPEWQCVAYGNTRKGYARCASTLLNVKLFNDSLVKIIGDVFECYDSIINLFGGQCQII